MLILKQLHGSIRAGNTKKIVASAHSGGIKIESINEICEISVTSGTVKIRNL